MCSTSGSTRHALVTVLPGLTAATRRRRRRPRPGRRSRDLTYNFSPAVGVSLGGRYTNDNRHAHVLRQNLILGGPPELGGSSAASASAFPGRADVQFRRHAGPTRRSRRALRSTSSRTRTTTSTSAIREASKAAASTRAARLDSGADAGPAGHLQFHDVQAREGRQLRSGLEGLAVRSSPAVRDGDLRCRIQGRAGPGSAGCSRRRRPRPSAGSRPTPARHASAASSSRPTARRRRISRRAGDRLNFPARLAISTPNTRSSSRHDRRPVGPGRCRRRTARSRTRRNGR